MGLGKTYSTRYLADSNNNTGVAGQVLISTATGIDWSDGSDIIGGPYLPLSAGVNFPLTGALYGGDAFFSGYIKFGGYSYIGEDLTETDSLTIASDNTESIFFAHYYPATSTYTTTMEISPSGELKMPMAADGDKLTIQGSAGANNNIIEIGQTGSDGYLSVSAAGGGIVTHLSGYTGTASYFLSNVGIGTTNPGTLHSVSYGTTRLHVDGGTDRGQMIIEGDSFAGIVLSDNGATANQRVFATSVDEGKYSIKPINDDGTSTANGVAVTVLHGGNVGIGETAPESKLEISDSSIGTDPTALDSNFLMLTNKDLGTGAEVWGIGFNARSGATNYLGAFIQAYGYFQTAGNTGLIFGTRNTSGVIEERMRIDSAGNVGIGTDSPVAISTGAPGLTLNGTNTSVGAGLIFQVNGTTKSYQYVEANILRHQAVAGVSQSFWTNGSEKMRIDTSGNVGIGTTSPASKLEVSGRISGGELGNSKITRNGLGLYVDFNDKACISGESSTEKPIDLGPNNYDLTLSGGANFEYKDGLGTFYFDGSADHIVVNDFVVADTTNSYEIWHWANAQTTYETWWDSGNERPLLGTYGDQLIAYPAYSGSALGITIATGQWYHVVWAFGSNNDLDIFVNGVRVHEALAGTIAQRTGTFDAWLGGDLSAETTNGYIAIARTYSRQLTPADVLQNYNADVESFATQSPFLGLVSSGGNVGVGTNTPTSPLEVKRLSADRTTLSTIVGITSQGSGPYTGFGGKISFNSNIYYGSTTPGLIETAYVGAVIGATYETYSDLVFGTRQSATTVDEKMRIAGKGEVLIGTTAIVADVKLRVVQTENQWVQQIISTGGAYGLSIDTSASTHAGAGSLQIYTNTGVGFIVQNDGKVGIGTASPTTTLSVKGTSSNGINIIGVGTTASRCFLGLNASNFGYLFVTGASGQNPAVISSQGNSYITAGDLIIGATAINGSYGASNTILAVKGSSSGGEGIIQITGLGNNATDNVGALNFHSQAEADAMCSIVSIRGNADDVGSMAFLTNNGGTNTERLRILSGGNVGIGNNNSTALYPLDVHDAITSGVIIRAKGIGAMILIESNTAGEAYLYQKPNQTGDQEARFMMTANSTYGWAWSDDGSGTPASRVKYMKLDQNPGTLTVKGDIVAYGTPSDISLKENIKPIDSALDKVMKLQGVTFDWKKTDSILELKEDIGFIAQDVQKVVPELIRENSNGLLSMRHQGVAPILLEAIKELKAEIDLLKSKPCTCNKCNCNI
jgi:hypothetical protein